MDTARVILRNVAVAAPLSLLFVFAEADAAILLVMIWGAGLLLSYAVSARRSNTAVAKTRLRTHFLVLVLTTMIAAMAPGKRIDLVLQREVTLPQTDWTIAGLTEHCKLNSRPGSTPEFPLKVHLSHQQSIADAPVRFPDRRLTLQQFIDAIEEQTNLRHSFGGCGNAYSVVRGSAYNFGLFFSDSKAG